VYTAPFIDATGIHIPTYQDILDDILNSAKLIFGEDIYLAEDSQDYQFISIIATKINDVNELCVMAYNNRSPITAVGIALDSLVKLNGIKRNASTKSTVTVLLTGDAGTVITNGVVSDVRGFKWNLPATVTISMSGTVYATATCQTYGPNIALPSDITTIDTPTLGWTSVTNETSATLGTNTEQDSMLRARQTLSVARPSLSILEQTVGGILELPGVTRANVLDNDTSVTDLNGIPSHSVSAVVEGGVSYSIAESIFKNKGIGGGTYGNTSVNVTTDDIGSTIAIRFSRPEYIDVDVEIQVKALNGYTTATTDSIKQAVVNYLNSVNIGASLYASSLWGVALQTQDLNNPIFSITSIKQAQHLGSLSTSDIIADYDQAIRGNITYINIVVT
jgi:uncharacterized phage protein gp47/JayE